MRQRGLALTEALIVLACTAIVAAVMIPGCAHAGGSRAVNCGSNLKQIGLAWISWSYDNESREFIFRTPVEGGGTFGSTVPLKDNAWWHYSIISNELGDPRVLVCPADRNVGLPRRPALRWGSLDTNGFVNSSLRHRATSYTICLDPGPAPITKKESVPVSFVLGTDRNIQFDATESDCSSGINGNGAIRVRSSSLQNPRPSALWTNAIHGAKGNILRSDSTVQSASSKELDYFSSLGNDKGNVHFLAPK